MGQILSQDEVDALLKGVVGGDVETETQETQETKAVQGDLYNFSAQDKVIRGRMPSLDAINDRFARFFRNTLSSLLHKMVDVTAVSLETLKFGNFMRSLSVPSSIHIVRIESLRGNALIVLETKLVFALIESFFGGGGTGSMKIEGRDFTAIEQRILRNVVDASIKDLANAWSPIYEMTFSYVRSEMNPQFAGIIPNDDVLIVEQFEVEMEEMSGNVMIGIPYMLIEPIRDRLYSSFHTEEKTMVDTGWVSRLTEEICNVYVNIQVELGHATISPRDLSLLKPGDIMVLDHDVTDPLKVNAQGLPKFYARPGKYRENIAIEIVNAIDKQLY
ncbi:MAG: flagellar motor switch protein FliM [Thermodesulfobacteriota bacterium]|nr:flagellar motor switch protein FliM [Thermodesulfobacteriota bacterium]